MSYPPYPPYPPPPGHGMHPPPPPQYGFPPYPMPHPEHYPPPPPHPEHYPPPPPHPDQYPPPPPQPYPPYATVMVPVPMMPAPIENPPPYPSQPTYITNYIYHGQTDAAGNSGAPAIADVPTDAVQVVQPKMDFTWVPSTNTTAHNLIAGAVVGGHEGWDGSPLYVIRSHHDGDLLPGKLSLRHNMACVPHGGKEIQVQNIEVLCAKPADLKWVPASNGAIPAGAVPGGRTNTGEQLYVGRARYQLSLTPGKVHASHGTCYISFAGGEISCTNYDVLCSV